MEVPLPKTGVEDGSEEERHGCDCRPVELKALLIQRDVPQTAGGLRRETEVGS